MDKQETRELLNKLVEQIDIIEKQCDSMMEIMAELNKDMNEGE